MWDRKKSIWPLGIVVCGIGKRTQLIIFWLMKRFQEQLCLRYTFYVRRECMKNTYKKCMLAIASKNAVIASLIGKIFSMSKAVILMMFNLKE